MAKWEYAVVTNDGLSLQAKLGSGSTMVFTKVKSGAGSVSAVLLQQQTDVTNPKQEFLFSDNPYYLTEPGAAELSFVMVNDGLTESYSCYQLGVYAEDPDKGEILYAILQTASPLEVPTAEEDAGWSAEFNVAMQYGNAENVSVFVNASGAMSRQAADKRYMKKVVYQEKLHELVWDETGVWLKEVEEDPSGEATEVTNISEADMEMLKETFIEPTEMQAYVDQQITLVTATGIPKLNVYPLPVEATEDGQTVFNINLSTFDAVTDTVLVQSGITLLSPNRDYSVVDGTVVLTNGVPAGRTLDIWVFKNVPMGDDGSVSGKVIAPGTLPLDRLEDGELAAAIQSLIDSGVISMSAVKSVQRGVITIEKSASNASATISEVNLSKSVVVYGGASSPVASTHNGSYAASAMLCRLWLDSSTVVKVEREYAWSTALNVPYQVIEYA